MSEKRYVIDVEDENYENAVFCGEEFICYEDDSEQLVNELNKLSSDKELLNIDYKNCLDYNRTLINENEQLKKEKKELQSKAKTLLDFYSKRYGDAIFSGQRHRKTFRDELWMVKGILSELGLYNDDLME